MQESYLDFHQRQTLFVNVILPLSISKRYTYRVPYEMEQEVVLGKRVIVQFGKSRLYTAVIAEISTQAPELYEAKYLIDVIDAEPIVLPSQLIQWAWLAQYYMCNEGDILQAALPSALKLASETVILLQSDVFYEKEKLTDKEFLVVEALEVQPELRIAEVVKILGQKSVFKVLNGLLEYNIICIAEELNKGYTPLQKSFIALNPIYDDQAMRRSLFEILEKTPKQLNVFLTYLKLVKTGKWLLKRDLLREDGISSSSLKTLIQKDVFLLENKEVSRLIDGSDDVLKSFILNEAQQTALDSIKRQMQEHAIVLLHGVTASGKTQIYVRLIEDILSQGKQVLFLLPEIALTTQIIERLRAYFGSIIGIYHSRIGDNERAEVWAKLLKKEYSIILGARSSVFLPFSNIGLIIVDEEHENSYKQYDPSPRYHARDAAIFLASQHQGKVLLGSATPSFESYYNAKLGKYGFVELMQRFGESTLPDIKVIGLNGKVGGINDLKANFSEALVQAIKLRLEKNEQVIIFQNRRGYAPIHVCNTCGFVPHCLNCDVSLTYHKSSGKLHCHYCGFKQDPVSTCPACGSSHIEQKGIGTERIEDDLQVIFPNARVARMDLDTTRAKNAFQSLINDFSEHRIDILVGTQIVAKGLDFDNVTLIGVINADQIINYPDFRAIERSFQLLSQVSGRAGRRKKKGEVIIQTYDSSRRVLKYVIENDYTKLFNEEILERRNFSYPPLYRMIRLDIKHKDSRLLNYVSASLAEAFRRTLGGRVLGPEDPLISRLRNLYIRTIYIKIEREGISVNKIKQYIRQTVIQFHENKENKGVIVQIDVDPY